MRLFYHERLGSDANAFLAIIYTEKDSAHLEDEEDSGERGAASPEQYQGIDQSKVFTSVTLLMGKKFD